MSDQEELWTLILRIPVGRVASYGDLGRVLTNPVSGLLVGRWMKASPSDLPWWRVVGKDGSLLIGKESPHLAIEQEERLGTEGITLEGGRVPASAFIEPTELLDS